MISSSSSPNTIIKALSNDNPHYPIRLRLKFAVLFSKMQILLCCFVVTVCSNVTVKNMVDYVCQSQFCASLKF